MAMPGTFSFNKGADKKKALKDGAPADQMDISTITWGDLTWVNVPKPTEREVEWLANTYNFHPLALDDVLSRKQISKIDNYPSYLFFVFHHAYYQKETRIASKRQWFAFLSDNYLITVNTSDLRTLGALFRDCQANEDTRKEYLSSGSGFLLYRIIDRSIDSYFPVLDKILNILEDVEDAVFDEDIEAAKEVSVLRRDIITQRTVMFPTREILVEMENKLKRFSRTDLTPYYNDLMDHMDKICNSLDECKEMIEVFKDTDSTLATNRLNRVMRILTIISTITLPFLAISGIFGMNVFAPGGIEKGDITMFIILIVLMFAIAGGMLLLFKRRRWI
jgi:magnesium transporter